METASAGSPLGSSCATKGMERLKAPNSNDIARLAGVSRSTVSRVINHYPNVPEETRKRVMKVIKELHYYPQLSGQLLSGRPSRTLGLFWLSKSSIVKDALSGLYYLNIVDAAAARDYLVLSCMVESLADKASANQVRKVFMEGRIDAGIFIGAQTGEPLIDELVELGKVVGLFDYSKEGDPCPNRLTVNFDPAASEQAVDHLCAMGHRRIAVIDGDMRRLSSVHRHESYMRAMQRHGLPLRNEWLCYGGITRQSGYEAAKKLLTDCHGDYPTAICANNDAVAFGVYQACAELGLSVPQDISVIGNDGHSKGADSAPPLTTVAFDFERMFASLVNRVVDTVEQGPQPQTDVFMPGRLIKRGSVRRLET